MLRYNLQVGSVLVLTLLMLLFLQFVAMAVVNSTNISGKVVSNFQIRKQLEISANNAVNYILGKEDYFVNYSAYLNGGNQFDIPLTAGLSPSISAKLISFNCIDSSAGNGYSCGIANQYWQLIVEVEDAGSKASLQIVQGIKLSPLSKTVSDGDSKGVQTYLIQGIWWYLI